MLSQFTSELGHLTLADLGFTFPKDVYSIGRLDHDSEGLLLLSNDNALKTRLLNPKNAHKKTYVAQVEGIITEEALMQLRRGVSFSIKGKKYRSMAAEAELVENPTFWDRDPPVRYRAEIPTSWLKLSITEGKNRQVRRMTAAVGFPTLRLIRTEFAQIKLNDLEPGQVKEIDSKLIEKYF